jgi:TM2 domain-containing membrane protein YozV
MALLLTIFLGGIGIHKFYLGRPTAGVWYLATCWTLVPFLLSILDFLFLLALSKERFNQKYNGPGVTHYHYH